MNTASPSFPAARLRYDEHECLLYPGKSFRIGRSAESDVIVKDPKVSRNHAVVEWDGSGFTIRDLGSSNGTYVNGQRLQEMRYKLQDGDQIQIYKLTLFFDIVQVETPSPAAEPTRLASEAKEIFHDPRLLVQSGPDQGKEFVLWGDRITIGRDTRNASWEIRLTDRMVSRPHACIELEGGRYFLLDLGGVNGTLLNGVRVEARTLLKHGDLITLGETVLYFFFQ